jgi:hypothetical protein
MRKIVAGLYVSLDGVTESPEKWTFPYFNDEVGQVISSQMAETDAGLLSRRTYEEFAAYWPNQTAEDNPFADHINNMPKFVVSTTLQSVEWRNSTLITGDVAGQLTHLKELPGKNISLRAAPPWCGGYCAWGSSMSCGSCSTHSWWAGGATWSRTAVKRRVSASWIRRRSAPAWFP